MPNNQSPCNHSNTATTPKSLKEDQRSLIQSSPSWLPPQLPDVEPPKSPHKKHGGIVEAELLAEADEVESVTEVALNISQNFHEQSLEKETLLTDELDVLKPAFIHAAIDTSNSGSLPPKKTSSSNFQEECLIEFSTENAQDSQQLLNTDVELPQTTAPGNSETPELEPLLPGKAEENVEAEKQEFKESEKDVFSEYVAETKSQLEISFQQLNSRQRPVNLPAISPLTQNAKVNSSKIESQQSFIQEVEMSMEHSNSILETSDTEFILTNVLNSSFNPPAVVEPCQTQPLQPIAEESASVELTQTVQSPELEQVKEEEKAFVLVDNTNLEPHKSPIRQSRRLSQKFQLAEKKKEDSVVVAAKKPTASMIPKKMGSSIPKPISAKNRIPLRTTTTGKAASISKENVKSTTSVSKPTASKLPVAKTKPTIPAKPKGSLRVPTVIKKPTNPTKSTPMPTITESKKNLKRKVIEEPTTTTKQSRIPRIHK